MNTYYKKAITSVLSIAIALSMLILSGCSNSARERDESTGVEKHGSYSAYCDAQEFLQNINCGWNLGNTLEATGIWGKELPANYSVNDIETGWGNPTTTKAMFDAVKNAGFNAVRIPVSWYRFVTVSNDKYTIKPEYLARVKEVVDYAHGNGLYVILNMHHDDKDWLDLSADDENWEKVKDEYKQLWEQISSYFKDYDEKLLLEGANEIVLCTSIDDDGNKQYDWWGQEQSTFDRLNELYQVFVDAVRNTGGNNNTRYLMIPTYGAQWYTQQLKPLEIPNNDPRVIVDIHWYTEDPEGSSAINVQTTLQQIYDYAEYYNIPIVLGECGIRNAKSDDEKVTWAQNYIKTASNMGFRCFIWDDGGDYQTLNRNTLKWNSESFVKAIVENAVSVDSQQPVTAAE